jgi:hypothetical protein
MPSQNVPEVRELSEAERTLRRAMWVPCRSKAALARWVRIYLGVDLPDGHVDILSNSSPMECLWEIYSKALANDDHSFNRILAYASRISFKTLIAAIMEVLCLVHLDRSVVHLASIVEQSQKAQEYVKLFFGKPFLRDFLVGDASTYTEIYRYVHRHSGDVIPPKEYKELSQAQKLDYEEHRGYIDITSCTMRGTNSKHAPFMVIDEVDVIEGQQVRAYEQAKLIPDGGPKENYKHPITLLISTRKTNFGKVQDEINNAQKTGLILRHWNVLDVSEPCPTSRHRPDQPHVTLYRNEKTLQVLSEEEFKSLDENRQLSFEARDAFWGCRNNCQLFGPCEGRLATINTDRTGALKPLSEITTQFRNVGLEMAIAELLCRRPGSEGLIYPSLDETVHLLTAAQLATLITGEHVSEPFEKEQLIHLMLARDMRPVAGVDFGFSHNFSLALGFTDGNRIYVVGAASQPELMPDKQLALAKKHLKPLRNPEVENDFLYSARIYPDTENSQMIAVFKNGGLNCVRWKKGSGSLLAGIEAVRVSLSAVVGHPRLLFLRGDPMVEYFFQRLSAYNWKLDAAGRPSDEPNEENDDECDCTRYMVMNVLGKYSGLVVAPDAVAEAVNSVAAVNAHSQLVGMPGKTTPKSTGSVLTPEQARQENWNRIAGMIGIPTIEGGEGQKSVAGTLSGDNSKGHKGSFSWSL